MLLDLCQAEIFQLFFLIAKFIGVTIPSCNLLGGEAVIFETFMTPLEREGNQTPGGDFSRIINQTQEAICSFNFVAVERQVRMVRKCAQTIILLCDVSNFHNWASI